MTARRRRSAWRLGMQLAIVGGALVAMRWDPAPAQVDAWYTLGTYPRLQGLLTGTTNLSPFAWFDVVLVAVTGWTLWRVVAMLRAAWRRRGTEAADHALSLLTAGAVLYLTFLGLWGLNYRRTPLLAVLETTAPPQARDVERLGEESVAAINRLSADAHRLMTAGLDPRTGTLAPALQAVTRGLGAADGSPRPARLKHTLIGPWFRWAGIDGMTNPFGLEVLVNPDLLPVEVPFVAAHEWAHLAGFANEAEASYVGWLACLRGDPWAQYSGWLFLYWQLAGDLSPDVRARVAMALDPGPRADIAAIAERLRRGRVAVLQDGSWRVYDQYLKANRVPGGVRSYGEVVTLVLRARTTPDGMPVRRARH